jgi:hypothetical protein
MKEFFIGRASLAEKLDKPWFLGKKWRFERREPAKCFKVKKTPA